jgi:hypothetical protein
MQAMNPSSRAGEEPLNARLAHSSHCLATPGEKGTIALISVCAQAIAAMPAHNEVNAVRVQESLNPVLAQFIMILSE